MQEGGGEREDSSESCGELTEGRGDRVSAVING